ncbi:MAG: glutathione S-transferase family protein [Pseudooceanicola sp.]
MAEYTLYYWPIRFRGQFVRAVLSAVGADWREAGAEETAALKQAEPGAQAVPHMGPPVLVDHGDGLNLSQMPAILGYLGRKHGLVPDDRAGAALTDKILADANDVLYEMTRYNGAQMWTDADWAEFVPRLDRWMAIFEATGRRNGLRQGDGFMLGTPEPGLADYVTATLWGEMTRLLPSLRRPLSRNAPCVAALCDRIAALPEQAALISRSEAQFGYAWCGGQIEASLRSVTGADQ